MIVRPLKVFFLLFCSCLIGQVYAQHTVVRGVVMDSVMGETVPFANIRWVGKTDDQGVMSDLDGKFVLESDSPTDSIQVMSMGFKPCILPIQKGKDQTVRVPMLGDEVQLEEAVVEVGEKQSHKIMRKVVAHKKANDIRSLPFYQYEAYSKLEVDVDNISEQFKKKRLTRGLGKDLENLKPIKDEKGREYLPMFISETISDYYHKSSPESNKEVVKATNVKGVGVDDGSFISQLIGTSFQQFNFYQNSLSVLDKEFVSPITDSWKANYVYILDDSLFIDGNWCYEIEVRPRRKQDLAFHGKIWITDTTFALKRIDLEITSDANLNYIDGVHIRQDYVQSNKGAWYVSNADVSVDVAEISEKMASMVVKSKVEVKNFETDSPTEKEFFDTRISVADNAQDYDESYWENQRPDSLSQAETRAFTLVDSLKELPRIRTYIDIVQIAVNGYYTKGKLDFGPYIYTYANNEVEGSRFRLGLRTNEHFSKKWEFSGYGAYGTRDKTFKYSLGTRYIFSRKPWTEFGLSARYDLDQLGVTDNIQSNSNLFDAFTRWGNIVGGYYGNTLKVYAFRSLHKNVGQKVSLQHRTFNPVFPFSFETTGNDGNVQIQDHLATTEVVFETHFGKEELFVEKGNNRVSLRGQKGPAIDLKLVLGFANFLGGEVTYQKLGLTARQRIGVGAMGQTRFWLRGGYIFSAVPFPLLEIPLGNESPVFANFAFNTMNYFEFVSDAFVSLTHEHHFDGFFMNRIPLIRRLKWRMVTNFSMIYGGLRPENRALLPDDEGLAFSTFDDGPYMEVGYGLENIFKIFRVQVFHRLSYLDADASRNLGVKIGLQFRL